MYLEVLKSLFKLQISPAWTIDVECDSSEPHSCSGFRHAEKWPSNLKGRWAYLFSVSSETQYVYPLMEQSGNSPLWWPTVSGVSRPGLGTNRHCINDTVYISIWGLVPHGALREHHRAHRKQGAVCLYARVHGCLCVFLLWYEALICKPSQAQRE